MASSSGMQMHAPPSEMSIMRVWGAFSLLCAKYAAQVIAGVWPFWGKQHARHAIVLVAPGNSFAAAQLPYCYMPRKTHAQVYKFPRWPHYCFVYAGCAVHPYTGNGVLCNLALDAEIERAIAHLGLGIHRANGHVAHKKLCFTANNFTQQAFQLHACRLVIKNEAAFKMYVGPTVLSGLKQLVAV